METCHQAMARLGSVPIDPPRSKQSLLWMQKARVSSKHGHAWLLGIGGHLNMRQRVLRDLHPSEWVNACVSDIGATPSNRLVDVCNGYE